MLPFSQQGKQQWRLHVAGWSLGQYQHYSVMAYTLFTAATHPCCSHTRQATILPFSFVVHFLKAPSHKTHLFFSCFRDISGSSDFSAASPFMVFVGLSGSLELLHGPKGANDLHLKSIPVLGDTAAGGAQWT